MRWSGKRAKAVGGHNTEVYLLSQFEWPRFTEPRLLWHLWALSTVTYPKTLVGGETAQLSAPRPSLISALSPRENCQVYSRVFLQENFYFTHCINKLFMFDLSPNLNSLAPHNKEFQSLSHVDNMLHQGPACYPHVISGLLTYSSSYFTKNFKAKEMYNLDYLKLPF